MVWRYLVDREDREDQEATIFLNRGSHPFNPNNLRHLIVRLADKAGVKDAHPHKFRHTFAITYLRSGGDVLPLQALLGLSSLDMVRHYAQIAEMDIERVHHIGKPSRYYAPVIAILYQIKILIKYQIGKRV